MKEKLLNLVKNAKKIQEDIKKIKKNLSLLEVEGQSPSGLVKVCLTCKNKVKKIFINPSLLKENIDMLEDLIIIAFNDAINKAKKKSKEKINNITNDMKLPLNLMDLIKFF